MALIVEDGSQVAGANAYAAEAAILAYAVARGVTLDPFKIPVYNAIAIDYLEGKRKEYAGYKVSQTQALQFPRTGLVIDGYDFPPNSIPIELIKANCQLIIEQSLGVALMPTQNEPLIKSEAVGPIKTEYVVSAGSIFEPWIASVEILLAPLLKAGSGGFGLVFKRV